MTKHLSGPLLLLFLLLILLWLLLRLRGRRRRRTITGQSRSKEDDQIPKHGLYDIKRQRGLHAQDAEKVRTATASNETFLSRKITNSLLQTPGSREIEELVPPTTRRSISSPVPTSRRVKR